MGLTDQGFTKPNKNVQKCPKCGEPVLEEGQTFCKKCGYFFEKTSTKWFELD